MVEVSSEEEAVSLVIEMSLEKEVMRLEEEMSTSEVVEVVMKDKGILKIENRYLKFIEAKIKEVEVQEEDSEEVMDLDHHLLKEIETMRGLNIKILTNTIDKVQIEEVVGVEAEDLDL